MYDNVAGGGTPILSGVPDVPAPAAEKRAADRRLSVGSKRTCDGFCRGQRGSTSAARERLQQRGEKNARRKMLARVLQPRQLLRVLDRSCASRGASRRHFVCSDTLQSNHSRLISPVFRSTSFNQQIIYEAPNGTA